MMKPAREAFTAAECPNPLLHADSVADLGNRIELLAWHRTAGSLLLRRVPSASGQVAVSPDG